MEKIKFAGMILSSLSAILTAAKAVVSFIKCIIELKTKAA